VLEVIEPCPSKEGQGFSIRALLQGLYGRDDKRLREAVEVVVVG